MLLETRYNNHQHMMAANQIRSEVFPLAALCLAGTRVRGFNFENRTFIGGASWLSSTTQQGYGYRCDETASGSPVGRFTTPDPLMASAHASNPQSWNRYSYALNNPLRYVDPDGLDVPAACAEDKNCQIVVKVNVIYDNTVNGGRGLMKAERQAFEKVQLGKAKEDFGNSNIKLTFSYTAGSYTGEDGNHQPQVTGLQADALNLVVSTATPNGHNVSGVLGGAATTFLNFTDVINGNYGPVNSNSTEHEFGHQFLGDPFSNSSGGAFAHFLQNMGRDLEIDTRNILQQAGASQGAYRTGLEPRRYAVPANPEANKPQK